MPDLDQSRRMLLMAEKDLKALTGMVDAESFDDEVFGFHAQQATEKALKAWLELLGTASPRTHDLGWLLRQLSLSNVDVKPFVDLLDLNLFAVQFRYEAMTPLDDSLDRSDILHRVTKLIDWVHEILAQSENSQKTEPP